jgi:CheY-like chemotaxis protein
MPHVLVVEDDPVTARVLCQVLKSRGASLVVHAGTVADALKSLDPAPDWVILDLDLPDGRGLEVMDAVRAAGLPTRIVVSAATADPGLMATVVARNPDVIIPKPLNPALLPIAIEG